MRGMVLVLLGGVVACTPVKTPHEVGINDPNYVDPAGPATTGSGDAPKDDEKKVDPAQAEMNKHWAASMWGGGPKPAAEPASAPAAPTVSVATTGTDDNPHLPPSFGGKPYDRTGLEVILNRASRQVKANCGSATDEDGHVNGPWGKTTVSVKLGHNGHSKAGTVPAPFAGKSTGNCAITAFANLIYAPFAGDDASVDWPVEIVKP